MRNVIAAFLCLLSTGALAQSNPGWSYGTVPTPAQWAAAFSSKQDVLNFVPLNVAGGVMTGRLVTTPPSAAVAGFNLTPGSTPASPVNGDLWATSVGLFAQINGSTIGPFAAAATGSFTGTLPIVSTSPSPGVINYAFNFSVANTFLAQQTDQGATTTQPGWYVQLAGDTTPRVRVGLNSTDIPSLAFGPGNAVRDVFLERMGPGALRLGTVDAAVPVAQTLSVQNVLAGTSNTAGAALTVAGSQGTGSGAGGDFIVKVAPAGSTGTAQNALVAALHVFGADGGVSIGTAAVDEGTGTLNLAGGLYNNGAAPTGTGGYVRANAASFVTPALGVATATSVAIGGCTIGSNALCVTGPFAFSAGGSFGGALTGITTASMSGQLTSTVGSGTAPFVVASPTVVANLNAALLNGATFTAPGAIGGATPGSGAFTTLSASGLFSLNNGGSWGGTISGGPALSGTNFITRANLAQVAASSLSGNPTGSLANESAITLGSTLNFSGTTLNCTAGSSTQSGCLLIDNSTITIVGGKIQASGGAATAITSGLGGTTVGGTTFAGGVLTNVAGVLGTTTAGTLGQALVSSGGTTPPTFQPGTWVRLSTQTLTTQSAIFDSTNITANYNEYEIVVSGLTCSSGSATPILQIGTGSPTVSYQATGYLSQVLTGNSSSTSSQTLTTGTPLMNIGACPTSGAGVDAHAFVYKPSASTIHNVHGFWSVIESSGTLPTGGTMNSVWNTSGPVTGLQVTTTSGTISGTFEVYGRL